MAFSKNIIALDIGSYKITCMSGEVGSNGSVKVNKISSVASKGISNGTITNMELAKKAITTCIEGLEKQLGARVKSLYVTISGLKPKSYNISETIKILSKKASSKDVNRLLNTCKKKVQNETKSLLHATPFQYYIDGNVVENPVGMIGKELKLEITMTTCDNYVIENVKSLIEMCHVEVIDIAFDGYMAAIGALDEEESDLKTAVINIGCGTTSVSVFREGKLISCASFDMAGDTITNDIMKIIAASKIDSEQIKIKHAHAILNNSIAIQNPIEFHHAGEKESFTASVEPSTITEIVKARLEKIFEVVKTQTPYFKSVNRIVLTGGSSQIENISELSRTYFKIASRVAKPNRVINMPEKSNNPMFATIVGLTRHSGLSRPKEEEKLVEAELISEGSLLTRLISWVKTEL